MGPLNGGRCRQAVVSSGLTVLCNFNQEIQNNLSSFFRFLYHFSSHRDKLNFILHLRAWNNWRNGSFNLVWTKEPEHSIPNYDGRGQGLFVDLLNCSRFIQIEVHDLLGKKYRRLEWTSPLQEEILTQQQQGLLRHEITIVESNASFVYLYFANQDQALLIAVCISGGIFEYKSTML